MTSRLRAKSSPLRQALAQQKWLTLIGLPVLILTMLNGVYALWGALFIYWGIVSATAGRAYLLENIHRREDPALFWLIVGLWIGSGLLYIYTDFASFL